MNKPIVLIIDDEPKFLNSLALLLKKDFHIITASNGREGLSVFESNPKISLILLDLDMPVMNGVEMLEKVREIDSDIKVLIMTGKSSHDWSRKCADLNVQGYMDKPFEVNKLLERMKELIGIMTCHILKNLWGKEYKMKVAGLSPVIKDALKYIRQNCHLKISRGEIAAYLDISPEYLSSIFKEEIGISLKEYITKCKIHKACEQLRQQSSIKIKHLAESIGIYDVDLFRKLFKEHTGMTPSEFRKKPSLS